LNEGKSYTIQTLDYAFNTQDVDTEAEGTNQNIHIALVNGEGFVDADKVHTNSSNQYADPLQNIYFGFKSEHA
jgi:hypothetical protein